MTNANLVFKMVNIILASLAMVGCDIDGSICAPTSLSSGDDVEATLSEEPAPQFTFAITNDGSSDSLKLQQRVETARDKILPKDDTASIPIRIHMDALHADHRDVDFVVKDGKKHYVDWCIGTQITMELFGGQKIVAESYAIREYDDSWAWEGAIIEGGTGKVVIHVDDRTKNVHSEISLYDSGRRLNIVPAGFDNTHVLYEFTSRHPVDAPSDMLRKSDTSRAELLRKAKRQLEAALSDPNIPDEERREIEEHLIKINSEIEKEAGDTTKPQSAIRTENFAVLGALADAQSTSSVFTTVRVLTLYGSKVAAPQPNHDLIVSDLEELFITNSGTVVDFEFALSSPIKITIPDESSSDPQVILSGIENGLYTTTNGKTTTQLRDQHAADLIVTIYNNNNASNCGTAWVGELPSNDDTGFAVVSVNCTATTAVRRAHEVGHNFGAGHNDDAGLFSSSRAFVEPGVYGTVMANANLNLPSIQWFSQTPPYPSGPLVLDV